MQYLKSFLLFVTIALALSLSSYSLPTYAESYELLEEIEKVKTERFELIKEEIQRAREGKPASIRLSTYAYQLDTYGLQELALLQKAAKEGVVVNLLIDGVGAERDGGDPALSRSKAKLKELAHSGVEVKIYRPRYRDILKLQRRNHTKILIGSNTMIVGDRNVADVYFTNEIDRVNSLSVDVKVNGGNRSAKIGFDELFESQKVKYPYSFGRNLRRKFKGYKSKLQTWAKEAQETKNVIFMLHDPDGGKSQHDLLLEAIRKAEKSIDIMNPYIVLTPEFEKEFRDAIKRGVKIRVMSNGDSAQNVTLIKMAWDGQRELLNEMGIEVYETTADNLLHAKSAVIDGKVAHIGSFNLDPRSQNLNVESAVFVEDKDLGKKMVTHFDQLKSQYTVRFKPIDPKLLSSKQRAMKCFKSSLNSLVTNRLRNLL